MDRMNFTQMWTLGSSECRPAIYSPVLWFRIIGERRPLRIVFFIYLAFVLTMWFYHIDSPVSCAVLKSMSENTYKKVYGFCCILFSEIPGYRAHP